METIDYGSHHNCLRLSNGSIEVVVPTEIGPRIIHYGLIGEENILGDLPGLSQHTPLGQWKPWGGHRLWAAPEVMPRSYAPDNDPVACESPGTLSVRLTGKTDAAGIGKELLVTIDETGSGVTVEHTITNHTIWGIDLAPWGLTIMKGGGRAILPQEPFIPHGEKLLPARPMTLWHYTDLTDRRWRIGREYIQLICDKSLDTPQKIGIANRQGWSAYLRESTLFIKRFPYREGATYPDMGSNNEAYTAGDFIELETLGPIVHLEPGESTLHIERWFLFGGIEAGTEEKELTKAMGERVRGQ